jgi:hypothetical protein
MQDVSEVRVLILAGGGARQFMKSIPKFFAPQFLPNESFCVIN